MKETEQFSFTATWNLVKRLADQISHPALAVAELIKNAYDADASKVYVNLEMAMQKDIKKCIAIIQDDGHGMTKKDLLTKWSNIGTSANKHEPFSQMGRAKQGGKGLGRFGAWKIGKKVTVVTKAKISIANFNLREGMRVGIKVTLRSKRMWDFWDRLVNLSLPRIRDFRGISANSFDGNGNYNLGIREHIIFPEIDYGKVDKIRSFQITIATSAKNDQEGYKLLQLLGMPFTEVNNG